MILGDYWEKRGYDDRAIAWYERAAIDSRKAAHRDPNAQRVLDAAERRRARLRDKASDPNKAQQKGRLAPGRRIRALSR